MRYFITALLVLACTPVFAQGRKDKEKKKDKESGAAALESSEARQAFDRARKAFDDSKVPDGLEAARDLLDKHGSELLDDGDGRLVPSGRLYRRLLAGLGAQDREAFERAYGEQASKDLPLARTGGRAALESFGDRYFPLESGGQALLLAADLATEEAAPLAAWTDLVSTLDHPKDEIKLGAARRLVALLPSLGDANVDAAAAELVADRLAESDERVALVKKARAHARELRAEAVETALSISPSGGLEPLRDAAVPDRAPDVRFLLPTCSHAELFDPLKAIPTKQENSYPQPPPPGVKRLLAGPTAARIRDDDGETREVLLVHLGKALIAHDGDSETRRWGLNASAIGEWLTGLAYDKWCYGHYGVTASRGVAWATLATTATEGEEDGKKKKGAAASEWPSGKLVAVSIKKGPDEWGRPRAEVGPDQTGLSFFGAPLVRGDRVYCGAATATSPGEQWVVALDRALHVVWKRAIITGDVPAAPQQFLASLSPRSLPSPSLAWAHGALIACSNNGVVAALEPEDGRIIWERPYTREDQPNAQAVWQNRGAPFFALLRRAQNPPVPVMAHAFVLPADSARSIWIRLVDGTEEWTRTRAELDTILGVAHGRVVACGERSVAAYDVKQGENPSSAWEVSAKRFLPATKARVIGRPVLTPDAVWMSWAAPHEDERAKKKKKKGEEVEPTEWTSGIAGIGLEDGDAVEGWESPAPSKHPEVGDLVLCGDRFFVVGFGRAFGFAEPESGEEEKK